MGDKCCSSEKNSCDQSKKEKCCDEKGSGFCCPITGFRFCCNKKFVISALVMIVWVNLFSWIWHGNVMSGMYQQTANLWRSQADMRVVELNLGLTLSAIVAAYIFMKGYEGSGFKEGLRFGIILTALFSGMGLVTHATQPIPYIVIVMWCLGDLIMYSLGGMLLSGLYCRMCGSSCSKT